MLPSERQKYSMTVESHISDYKDFTIIKENKRLWTMEAAPVLRNNEVD